jgi:hypothetical protein
MCNYLSVVEVDGIGIIVVPSTNEEVERKEQLNG